MKKLPSKTSIAESIDYAILKPDTSRETLHQELLAANFLKVYSVCVRPCDVEQAVNTLTTLNSATLVGTVIGFPHGANSLTVKLVEVVDALNSGAKEIDYVINIRDAMSGDYDAIQIEADRIAAVAHGSEPFSTVKAILETSYLSETQIINVTEAIAKTGVDFVKTSTGFAGGGATVPHVKLMAAHKHPTQQVKASGGVSSLSDYLALHEAGARRFGTSQAQRILEEWETANKTGSVPESTNKETY